MDTCTVLVVEDDSNLLEALRYNLDRERYHVVTAQDGEEALSLAGSVLPDLFILDIMLPSIDGLEVCRLLRRRTTAPILILTAKDEEIDKVVGLEIGADDYMTKPFSMRELLARVKALLRRTTSKQGTRDIVASTVSAGDLTIDLDGHQVFLNDLEVELKPKEYDLLVLLITNPGRAFTRDQLLEKVWGYDFGGDSRTVDVHVRWLRKKIEPDPSSPRRIITIRGTGYRFVE